MNLRAVDLNLLIVFDALMAERNVTRAGKMIGLSQPAMSNALARLRHTLHDHLLIRTPKGMQPTPLALELIEPAKAALKQVQKVFDAPSDFDPATSQRAFIVRMGDMNEFLMLPAVLERMGAESPRIALTVKYLPPIETVDALEADEIDLAVSTGLAHPNSIRSLALMEDRMVCLMRKGHPSLKQKLTLKRFLELRHIKIAQSATDSRFVDDDLAQHHLTRDIAASIPHFLAAPAMVARTDLVATISERMANSFDTRARFAFRRLPLGPDRFTWRLYWHRRYDSQISHEWLRSLISSTCLSLGDIS